MYLSHSRQRTRRFLGKAGQGAGMRPSMLMRQADVRGFENQETPKQIVGGNHLQMCHSEKSRTIANKLVKITFPQISLIF